MELVPAQLEDLDPLLTIYDRARQRMHAQGNFQWADDYPGVQRLRADLAQQTLYLLKIAGKTIGACALIPGPDETYQVIRDGQWLNPAPYWAIHRLVVDPLQQGQGYARALLQAAEQKALAQGIYNCRIDTHAANTGMRRLLAKSGYTYCGIIVALDGIDRLAYQKILPG